MRNNLFACMSLLLLAVAAVLHYTPAHWETRAAETYVRWPAPVQAAIFLLALGAFTLFSGNGAPFLYFQF